jgi:hypothetical protein
VPEGGDEGVDEELQHVFIAQDLYQSPEGPKANLASDYAIMFCYDCAFMFQELN